MHIGSINRIILGNWLIDLWRQVIPWTGYCQPGAGVTNAKKLLPKSF